MSAQEWKMRLHPRALWGVFWAKDPGSASMLLAMMFFWRGWTWWANDQSMLTKTYDDLTAVMGHAGWGLLFMVAGMAIPIALVAMDLFERSPAVMMAALAVTLCMSLTLALSFYGPSAEATQAYRQMACLAIGSAWCFAKYNSKRVLHAGPHI